MHFHDPQSEATRKLIEVATELVKRGGEFNALRAPLVALLRAQGQGKKARILEQQEQTDGH